MDAFKLLVDQEEMVVKLIASPMLPDTLHDAEMVRTALRENNVFKGIDFPAIDTAFAKLPDAPEGEVFQIATGEPAKHGENGEINFLVNISGKPIYDTTAAEDAKSVDFKSATRIESVKPGQILAKITPPTAGTPGYNLSGKDLPARNGKPVMYRLGEGTALDTDNVTIRATQEGRPVFAHRVVSVNPVYEVHSDVCFETGNIKFDGYVSVMGNVQDDFLIEAKNIEISGVVGAATIRCMNNLIIHGGINGHGKADVICRGAAEIKYVNAAKLEVKGDLNVGREIVNSTIWCSGKVRAGKILGGQTLALQGVEAHIFGSDLGIPTTIEPGCNYELRRIDEALEVLAHQINKIVNPIRNLLGDHKKFLQLPADKRQELTATFEYFLRLKTAHDKLNAARRKLLASDTGQPVKEVIVLKHLFPDVTIKTGSCVRQFRTEVNGPAALLEDIANGTIRTVGYNPAKGAIVEEAGEPAGAESASGAAPATGKTSVRASSGQPNASTRQGGKGK